MGAISTSASFNTKVNYTVTQAFGNMSVTDSDSKTLTTAYTHGTGYKQVNNGIIISGCLVSGETKRFDLYNDGTGILKNFMGTTIGVPIDRIKNFSLFNLEREKSSTTGCLECLSTGDYAIALFSSSISTSGAQKVRQLSSWSYNDPDAGVSVENESKYIYLRDCGGSGVCFHLTILGVDESQPTGTVPVDPYFGNIDEGGSITPP